MNMARETKETKEPKVPGETAILLRCIGRARTFAETWQDYIFFLDLELQYFENGGKLL